MPPASEETPGDAPASRSRTLLGRYRIEKTLGQGGMGEVLLALDTLLNRRVALKRLHPYGEDRKNQRASILKEARRASQINDRRIAAIYDVLDLDDEIVLVMEYVEGVTLRERMAEPVPIETFWDLSAQCVEGLAAAHAQGVIHRDIKPENLMVTGEGGIKILDFGIARRSESVGPATTPTISQSTSQRIAGTPQYMAPEAHLGGRIDERTDIFSLGVVFYELLTTKRPFEGSTYAAIVDRVLNATPPPVLDTNPAAGAELSGVVEKMIAKNPADRFATLTELKQDLDHAHGAPVAFPAAAKPRPRPTVSPPAARAPWGAWRVPALIALAVVALAALGVWWRRSAAPSLPVERNVAVLAPAMVSADDFSSFTLGAIDLLSRRLQKHVATPGFQMASFQEGLDERVRSAAEARKILGVNVALVPTLEQTSDVLRARLDLLDTASDRVIASRSIQTPASKPFLFLDQTYRAAAGMLGLNAGGGDPFPGYGIRGAGTLRFYLQGIGRLHGAATLEDARKAIEDLEVACRTEPEAAVARAALAAAQLRAHALSGDSTWLARAEATAREAVALDSARSEPHRSLAMVLAQEKNNLESSREFARASGLDPTDDEVSLRLARVYGRMGQRQKEKETYLATIQRRPHSWQPYWWLATWHFREGNVDESIRAYEEMVRRSPNLYKGYSSLGGVLVLRGDYPRAITTLRHSVELRPTKIAFDNLGTAYFNSGRFAEAVDAYNQSFQFGFADYQSWLNLGDAYFWLRDRKDQASGAYAQAVRLGREEMSTRARSGHSADVMIPANLATVFARLGEPDSARLYLRHALAADSANPMVAYCAALTYWQLNEKRRAIPWLERSVRGGYPTVWLRDSPIFQEWRGDSGFRALVAVNPESQHSAAPH